MNALQTLITRLFRLEKPVDKRLIWAGFAVLAIFAFVVFTGSNDASSSTFVAASGSSLSHSAGANPTTSREQNTSSSFSKPSIYVHIVGEVRRAGLYRLESGARVADAVFAAGGFSARAEQASINLARIITDGEQIVVARVGQFGQASNSGGNGTAGFAKPALINLNRADQVGIESLPGVGPTLAGRIVDWRLANGGFKAKADLRKVSGIGDKLFAKLKDLVTL